MLKYCQKKACGATLGKPNRSFVAFSHNILTLLKTTIDTSNEWLRQTIPTYSLMHNFYKSNYMQNYNLFRIEISK